MLAYDVLSITHTAVALRLHWPSIVQSRRLFRQALIRAKDPDMNHSSCERQHGSVAPSVMPQPEHSGDGEAHGDECWICLDGRGRNGSSLKSLCSCSMRKAHATCQMRWHMSQLQRGWVHPQPHACLVEHRTLRVALFASHQMLAARRYDRVSVIESTEKLSLVCSTSTACRFCGQVRATNRSFNTVLFCVTTASSCL